MTHPKDDEHDEHDFISKTDRKNEMLALQKTGEMLVKLSDNELDKMDLPERLLQAVKVAKQLKSHEAIRRQMQLIGKLMRNTDAEAIQIALKKIRYFQEKDTQAFHQAETWRELLISEGDDGLQKLLQQYPTADRQHLRQLIRNAQHDRAKQKKSGGELELFRYLRELIG